MGEVILDAVQYTNLKNDVRRELMEEVRMEFHTQMHMLGDQVQALDKRVKGLETDPDSSRKSPSNGEYSSRKSSRNGDADDHTVKSCRICDAKPGRNKSFRGCMDIMDVGQYRPQAKGSAYQLIPQEYDDRRTLAANQEAWISDKVFQTMSNKISELEEAVSNEKHDGPPDSMYNYCMQRLAASPDPMRDGALMWWFLLWSVQFVTLVSFSAYNDILNNEIGATQPLLRSHAVGSCLSGPLDFQGVPIVYFAMGLSAILLVCSVISADTMDALSAPFPSHEKGTIWWIKRFAWFWETVYMPGCFALEAAILFASSRDPLGVVTNTLQVTFIMDLDNMMYRNFLSANQKRIYMRREGCQGYIQKVGCTMRGMFALNIALMSTLFTTIAILLGRGELYGEEYLDLYWHLTIGFYILNFAGRCGLQGLLHDADAPNIWNIEWMHVLGASMLGMLFYFTALNLTTSQLILPPFIYFDDPAEFTCAHDGMSNVTRVMVG